MKIEKRELKNDSREENLDQLLFSSIIAEEVKANNTLDLGVDWSIIRTLKKKKIVRIHQKQLLFNRSVAVPSMK